MGPLPDLHLTKHNHAVRIGRITNGVIFCCRSLRPLPSCFCPDESFFHRRWLAGWVRTRRKSELIKICLLASPLGYGQLVSVKPNQSLLFIIWFDELHFFTPLIQISGHDPPFLLLLICYLSPHIANWEDLSPSSRVADIGGIAKPARLEMSSNSSPFFWSGVFASSVMRVWSQTWSSSSRTGMCASCTHWKWKRESPNFTLKIVLTDNFKTS